MYFLHFTAVVGVGKNWGVLVKICVLIYYLVVYIM